MQITTDAERWDRLAQQIHELRVEADEWDRRYEHEQAVQERRHLELVPDDDA